MVNTEILNYVIVRKIGEGGMGQVFLARNKSIHQFVAIKMLHPQFSGNPELRERFRQEAIMLSSLDHPNIVKFLNYVENEQGIFLIMEYVEGPTLEDFINRRNGLIVEQRAYPMFSQIIDAFAYAHGRGIIHRDIKPGNILMGKNGSVKILDFGIARIVSGSDEGNIRGLGTVSYMSPEQALGRQLDIRSDIYSLGVVFYQMLTGRPPYDETELSQLDIRKRIVESPLPPMRKVYPYITDGIQHVVDRATAKNPTARFRNCSEMRDAVDKARRAFEASQQSDKTQPAPAAAKSDKRGGKRQSVPAKRNLWPLWVTAAMLLLLIGGGAWWFLHNREEVRYYADYVEVWECAEGIDPLTEQEAKARPSAYRLEYSRGHVVRVSHVGPSDSVLSVSDSLLALVRFPDVEYIYDGNRLVAKKIYDAGRNMLMTLTYTDGHARVRADYPVVSDSTGTAGDSVPSTYYVLSHNPRSGKRVAAMMVDANGTPVCGSDSVYGYGYDYDKTGRVHRLTYLGKDKKARVNNYGVAYVGYDFGDDGLLTRAGTYDAAGKPVVPRLATMEVSAVAKPSITAGKRKKNSKSVYDSGYIEARGVVDKDPYQKKKSFGPGRTYRNAGSEDNRLIENIERKK